ncbi:MAG: RNA polymerase sigma factor [Betaproteobacteria bacterium]|nr:RNA polymerase sigma factor [Betaproteobacteria bacterium]
MASHQELSDFLEQIERRAFKYALFAVRDEEAALDLVQDAMLKLAEKYAGKPADQLPMLFHRILQNKIRSHFRWQKIRSLWTTPTSSLIPGGEGEDADALETFRLEESSIALEQPPESLARSQVVDAIEEALKTLPARQREAFLLRYWEDMDIAQTAAAMGCSEGSVKTHCSRAVHALAAILKARGVTP